MISRELTAVELNLSAPEQLLMVLHWGMKKLRVYTETLHTTVVLPDKAMLQLLKD
jgi:hypothetical protein